ncbi:MULTISPECIES: hypothetical protein [unclassified Thalassospira]|uniref:hypothetical protein n=1 Tax=unclassified Thalassospira TaxID=2648997 RepID=UPI0007A5AB86|nr:MULTISPECIES: hypothetical protein [unclassified Thalassospira]KZC99712.1 hypothetical protein AUQ41_08525 [Thalassospira sp. MCCC 1A02898]ONH85360.1 hypothetical protein TH47_05815 [Thalassospira sp. MCCC 1A02803]
MSGDIFEHLPFRTYKWTRPWSVCGRNVFQVPLGKLTDVRVDNVEIRHAATIRSKIDGHQFVVLEPVIPSDWPQIKITGLTVTVEPEADDENIIDPLGSGPVPIEPIRIKTPSYTLDGVKTGLVVGR